MDNGSLPNNGTELDKTPNADQPEQAADQTQNEQAFVQAADQPQNGESAEAQDAYQQPESAQYQQPAYQQPENAQYQQPESAQYQQPAYQQPENAPYQQPAYQQPNVNPYAQSAQTKAPRQPGRGTRVFLRICNVLIALICAAAILGYVMMPLWKVSFGLKFDEKAADLIDEAVDNAIDEAQESLDYDKNVDTQLTKDITKAVTDCLREKEVELGVGFSLNTADIAASLFSSDLGFLKNAIENNADEIIGDLIKKIDKFIKPAAAAAAKSLISNQLDKLLDEKSGSEIRSMMTKSGVDSKWIEGRIQEVIDAITSGDATVDSVTEMIIRFTDDAVQRVLISQNTEESRKALDDYYESRGEIIDEIRTSLEQIADENGKVNLDSFITGLIEKSDSEAEALNLSSGSSLNLKETKKTVKEAIVSAIENVPEDTAKTVGLTVKATAAVLILTMFTWLYLIIKIIVKFARPNPGVRMWLPIVFGWWPFLILSAIPWCVMTFAKSFAVGLLDKTELPDLARDATGLLGNAHFDFFSGSFVAALAALALVLISFIYVPRRKKLRQMLGK